MNINFKNVEELIFFDKNIQKKLPEFFQLFSQWSLGRSISGLSNLSKRTAMEFLNSLDGEHIEILEEYFQDKIVIDKLQYQLVRHHHNNIDELEPDLCQFSEFQNFCIYRDKDQLDISFWR